MRWHDELTASSAQVKSSPKVTTTDDLPPVSAVWQCTLTLAIIHLGGLIGFSHITSSSEFWNGNKTTNNIKHGASKRYVRRKIFEIRDKHKKKTK